MSLGDYVRYLRALKGGPTPWQIEEATGVPSGIYRQIEQRYRAVGEDDTLARLAAYYDVEVDELAWRQEWSRKSLNALLADRQENELPITFELRGGEKLNGHIMWWDLGAVQLREAGDGLVVIQRHIVERWE